MSDSGGKKLRELISEKQIFIPDIWDCMSARIVEALGFEATMFSGAAYADSIAGYPDIGLITQDDIVRATEFICAYSPLPCIIDADDGYGESPLNTYRLAKRLAAAGAAAFSIEDSTGFRGYNRFADDWNAGKDYGTYDHPVVSRELWLAKIRAALEACAGTDCMVIARTEAHLQYGMEEAIERCILAHEAGADIKLIVNLKGIEEARMMAKYVPGNKIFPDIASRDGVPYADLKELEELGFNMVTCHFLEKGATVGMLGFGKHVLQDKNTVFCDQFELEGVDMKRAQMAFSSTKDDKWLQMEKRFMDPAGER